MWDRIFYFLIWHSDVPYRLHISYCSGRQDVCYSLSVASMIFKWFSPWRKRKHGRRDYRGSDLRDKIDRRNSPPQRYSPGRDARGRHTLHGYSPTRSPGKRSDRKRRKKQQLDGQSDFSGSVKISDGTGDRSRDRKVISSDSRSVHGEQLGQVRSEINMLNNHKCQLEIYLEERVQEVDCLTSRIHELEMQLCHEKDESRRITSKIKDFVKAHNRYSRIQNELKRSHDRLQKLGDQLGSDATRLGANEEDSSINILSDGETTGNHTMSPLKQLKNNASPPMKRLRMNAEESKSANLMNGEGTVTTMRSEKHYRWNVQHAREAEVEDSRSNGHKMLANEDTSKKGKIVFTNVALAEKIKGSEPSFMLPPTSMAAHAVDEVLETAEVEQDLEVVEKAAKYGIPGFPFPMPPPPSVPQNAYSEYRGEDENVDVEALEEEMVDVDIV